MRSLVSTQWEEKILKAEPLDESNDAWRGDIKVNRGRLNCNTRNVDHLNQLFKTHSPGLPSLFHSTLLITVHQYIHSGFESVQNSKSAGMVKLKKE